VVFCTSGGGCPTAQQGSSYIAAQAATGAQDPSNSTFWHQIAAAGANGTNGAAGATGATGPTGPTGTGGGSSATGFATVSTFSNGFVSEANNTTYYSNPSVISFQSAATAQTFGTGSFAFMLAPTACTTKAFSFAASNYYGTASDTITIGVVQNGTTILSGTVTTNGNLQTYSTNTAVTITAGDKISVTFKESNLNAYDAFTVSLVCQ
jgi:hypothetical protein